MSAITWSSRCKTAAMRPCKTSWCPLALSYFQLQVRPPWPPTNRCRLQNGLVKSGQCSGASSTCGTRGTRIPMLTQIVHILENNFNHLRKLYIVVQRATEFLKLEAIGQSLAGLLFNIVYMFHISMVPNTVTLGSGWSQDVRVQACSRWDRFRTCYITDYAYI